MLEEIKIITCRRLTLLGDDLRKKKNLRRWEDKSACVPRVPTTHGLPIETRKQTNLTFLSNKIAGLDIAKSFHQWISFCCSRWVGSDHENHALLSPTLYLRFSKRQTSISLLSSPLLISLSLSLLFSISTIVYL